MGSVICKHKKEEKIILNEEYAPLDTIISASKDKSLIFWDNKYEISYAHKGEKEYSRLIPLQGNKIATCNTGGEIEIMNSRTKEIEWSIKVTENNSKFLDICNLQNGQLATCSSDKIIRIWELPPHIQCTTNIIEINTHADTDRDRDRDNKFPSLLPTSPSTPVSTLEGHTDIIFSLIQHKMTGQLISGGLKGTVRVWDLLTTNCMQIIEHGEKVMISQLLELTDGRILSLCYDTYTKNNSYFLLWEIGIGVILQNIHHSVDNQLKVFNCGAVLDNGKGVLIGESTGELAIMYIGSWEISTLIKLHHGGIKQVRVVSDITVITSSADTTIQIYNLKTNLVLRTLRGHSGAVVSVLPLFDQPVDN